VLAHAIKAVNLLARRVDAMRLSVSQLVDRVIAVAVTSRSAATITLEEVGVSNPVDLDEG
jgi:hypothetical protein